MLIALLLAAALLTGVPAAIVAAGALAAVRPELLVLVAGLHAGVERWRTRRHPDRLDEVGLFHAIAGELRSGASLPAALQLAAAGAGEPDLARAARLAVSGASPDRVAGLLGRSLGRSAPLTVAAYRLASETGASAAAVFDTLAWRTADRNELIRERRALTSQARLSATIVGGAPLAFALVLLATGRGSSLLDAGPAGLAMAAIGLGLEILGLVLVAMMLRRADR